MSPLVFVYGTRPEAIKIAPVVAELRGMGVRPVVLATGQHWDLLKGTPAETDLADGHSLGLPSDGNVPKWLTMATDALRKKLPSFSEDPPIVVVQGDTMSALAGAQAASELSYPVAHIEAGIRSHDLDEPWPEEMARRKITELASWHYAPTSTAYANLIAEGVPMAAIRVTGNPGVSALARYSDAKPTDGKSTSPYILITLHRREFQRSPVQVVQGLMESVERWKDVYRFLWPKHPAIGMPPIHPSLQILSPLPYRQLTRMLAGAVGVLTDSGGVQEEAATLGVPCVCLRRVTDRPESIEAGLAVRCDPTTAGTAQGIEILAQLRLPRQPSTIYGFPDAAEQIARHLANLEAA